MVTDKGFPLKFLELLKLSSFKKLKYNCPLKPET